MADQPLATRWTEHTHLPSPAGTSMLGFVLVPRRHREVTKMYADLRTFLSLKESNFGDLELVASAMDPSRRETMIR